MFYRRINIVVQQPFLNVYTGKLKGSGDHDQTAPPKQSDLCLLHVSFYLKKSHAELLIRGGFEDNSKIIFLISQ